MSKKLYMYILVGVIALAIVLISNVFASTTKPGAEEDPLISKSYVDKKIEEAIKIASGTNSANGSSMDLDRIVAEVKRQINEGAVDGYIPVNAAKGQTLIGHEGTEIILRSGKATALCPESNGVVNVTAGSDLANGAEIKQNHLLIIPRYDGRGVYVASDEAWFLIKGGYDKA